MVIIHIKTSKLMNRKSSYLVGAAWRYVLLVCVLLVSNMCVWCVNGSMDDNPKALEEDIIYDPVETGPSFPGGNSDLVE